MAARAGVNIVPIYGNVKNYFGKIVGWVERSETHQFASDMKAMGFASLYPSYTLHTGR
jgi:hypothetical protein